ncbi:MAG: class I SAM-dependent methyltransferase [Candidatus Omnitrophica bacterium]|nr:class I SAM-dependent methyltransferase [Candidatus Omnitrophota bacterium]
MIHSIKSRLYKRKIFKILNLIKEYEDIEGWLTDKEAYGLYNIASKLKGKATLVEIGSWKGKSTYCIAKGLKKGKIYSIDSFNAAGEPGSKLIYQQQKGERLLLEQFKDKMIQLGVINKIEVLQGYSEQFINYFTEIDFLFIDGDHSIDGCKYDFEHYSPLIKPGGYLAFHDYYPERLDLGPSWVIRNMLMKNKNYTFFRQYDSLYIAKKVK